MSHPIKRFDSGARVFRDDSVLASVKVQVPPLVTDIMKGGQSLDPKLEVHMREVAMLGDMETNSDRGLIARLGFEIDVAHRRVERTCLPIDNLSLAGTVRKRMVHRVADCAGARLPARFFPVNITI